MTTYANIEHNLEFIEQRERTVVKQALQAVTALHDAVALKREIRLPVLAETRDAILELEDQIHSLKTELLRALSQHPEQLILPGMPDDPRPGVKTRPIQPPPDVVTNALRPATCSEVTSEYCGELLATADPPRSFALLPHG